MSNLRVAISAPIDSNLYSLLVTQGCIKLENVEIVGVIALKTFTIERAWYEYTRFGKKIFRKIFNKYFNANASLQSNIQNKAGEYLSMDLGLVHKTLKKLTGSNNIPFLKVESPNCKSSLEFLKKHSPDIILSIGSFIVEKPFLQIPKNGVFNVHMGILPEYRGIGVTEWPIIENTLKEIGLGVTLHLMERSVDTGPVLMKRYISLTKGDTLVSLEAKYLKEMVNLMILGVQMLRDKELKTVPQKKSEGKQYFETHKRMNKLAQQQLSCITNDDLIR
jgi:methionyl-tRNA formyltransferase